MRPLLFRLGPFHLYSYWVLVVAGGAVSAWVWRRRRAAMGLASDQEFYLLLNSIVLGAFLGGRLVHLALYIPFGGPGYLNRVFALRSGFSILGDVTGGAAAVWLFCRSQGRSFLRVMDQLYFMVPVWDAVGRMGCLLAGCCYGRPSSAPWAITFTDPSSLVPERLLGVPLHPSQLYESALGLASGAILYFLVLPAVEARRLPRGSVLGAGLALYSLQRFTTEFFRADAAPGLFGLTAAQTYVLGFAGAAALILAASLPQHAPHRH